MRSNEAVVWKKARLYKNKRKLKADYPHTPTDYRHTDKHLKLVVKVVGQTVQPWERKQTDRRYHVHYLPRFVVDNKLNVIIKMK